MIRGDVIVTRRTIGGVSIQIERDRLCYGSNGATMGFS